MKVTKEENPNTGQKHLNLDITKKDVTKFDHTHIVSLYNQAIKVQTDITERQQWYADAKAYAQSLADEFGLSLEKIVYVIAVLSPVTEWELNKRRARKAIESFCSGIYPLPAVHMWSKNTIKAYSILEGNKIEYFVEGDTVKTLLDGQKFKMGLKTERFALNILGNTDFVTVDSIAGMAATGIGHLTGTAKIADSAYPIIEKLYQKAAKIVGDTPANCQAIVWEFIRTFRTMNHGYTLLWDMKDENNHIDLFELSSMLQLEGLQYA